MVYKSHGDWIYRISLKANPLWIDRSISTALTTTVKTMKSLNVLIHRPNQKKKEETNKKWLGKKNEIWTRRLWTFCPTSQSFPYCQTSVTCNLLVHPLQEPAIRTRPSQSGIRTTSSTPRASFFRSVLYFHSTRHLSQHSFHLVGSTFEESSTCRLSLLNSFFTQQLTMPTIDSNKTFNDFCCCRRCVSHGSRYSFHDTHETLSSEIIFHLLDFRLSTIDGGQYRRIYGLVRKVWLSNNYLRTLYTMVQI